MTDFRALCAELVESVEVLLEMRSPNAGRMWTTERRLRVARAALADEPAVPKGREPVAVTEQPSDEDLWNTADLVFQANSWPTDAIRYARAVLARWGNPAPQPPAEGEVAELVQLLRHAAEVDGWDGASPEWCQSMLRAAELLQRLSPPQPVLVSERLPNLSPDAGDFSAGGLLWWFTPRLGWRLGSRDAIDCIPFPSHWLPAHALPLPLPEVGQ